jgi:hypothetical protein
MCTVTWQREEGAYRLYCNRDERKTRSLAAAPRIHRSPANTTYLAPQDPDHGGTWLAANEYGLTICVLNANGYNSQANLSRGLLPQALIDASNADQALRQLQDQRLDRFQPFTLAALDLHNTMRIAHWDGAALTTRCDNAQRGLLTSSSLSDAKAAQLRSVVFANFDGHSLSAFHRSHGDGDHRFSPCMHREDAETVSFSSITCTNAELAFFYSPGAPCLGAKGQTWTLPSHSRS